MSKLETVRDLNDSEVRSTQIRTVAELQSAVQAMAVAMEASDRTMRAQIATSVQALDEALLARAEETARGTKALAAKLAVWTEFVMQASDSTRRQMLDLAVLVEPLAPMLQAIFEAQEIQGARLEQTEVALRRVTASLPALRPGASGQPAVQPRLASSGELAKVPSLVWSTKPSMLGRS